MRRFIALFVALDASTGTNARIAALTDYFRHAGAADAAWATFFLTGRRMKRLVRARDLRAAAQQAAGIPEWLFEASHEAVGDLAETIALLLPPSSRDDERTLAEWVESELAPLSGLSSAEAQQRLREAWERLPREGRLVFNKLLTGAFRVGVARQLVIRALASVADVPAPDVAHRLTGDWVPGEMFWSALAGGDASGHRPYPFLLAHPLENDPVTLGLREAWLAEWKWDGIRAQLVARPAAIGLWSRGEESIGDAFPELLDEARRLPPGTVLDGEIVVWLAGEDRPRPFGMLQRRLNRATPGARLRQEAPAAFVAFDVLEHAGHDIRETRLADRRSALASLLPNAPSFRLSTPLASSDWHGLSDLRRRARESGAEGLMLKRLDSRYEPGRVRGSWWKWKIEPFRIDAVLVYAQPGHGRRASLFTDYTFALWDEGRLVPFAKAYSGLTDDEIRSVDAWVRRNTIERFGPVRRVAPELVFELAFEGVQRSTRHKSGVAVRFPRIARWRTDKPAAEADSIEALRALTSGPAID